MEVIISKTADEASALAADMIERRLMSKPNSVLGLATGSTPLGLYKELVKRHREKGLDFSKVTTFNLDEYLGLSPSHPQSYRYFMDENLFKHINVPASSIHVPYGHAASVLDFCEWYENEMKRSGGIDIQILGIGGDGHIAFNEPGSSLTSRTRVKTLTYDTRKANSRFFDNDVEKVPKLALTVGVGTVMDAEEVMILISGYTKARALRQCVEEGVNHFWTVSMLQLHRRGIIVCDDDATMELKVGTVKYFKDIERENVNM